MSTHPHPASICKISTRNYRNDPKTIGALNKTHRLIATMQARADVESAFMAISMRVRRSDDQREERKGKR